MRRRCKWVPFNQHCWYDIDHLAHYSVHTLSDEPFTRYMTLTINDVCYKSYDLIEFCALLIKYEARRSSQIRSVQIIVWQRWLFHEVNNLIVFSTIEKGTLVFADTSIFNPNFVDGLRQWEWNFTNSPTFCAVKFYWENYLSIRDQTGPIFWAVGPSWKFREQHFRSRVYTHMLSTSFQVLSLLITLNLSCKYVISQQINIVAGRGSELTRACWVHRDGVSTNSHSLEDVSCVGGLHLLRRDNWC